MATRKRNRSLSRGLTPPTAQFPVGFVDSFRFHQNGNDARSPNTERRHTRSQSTGGTFVKREEESPKRKTAKQEYLPEVVDHIKVNVDILFIGSNPGRTSSQQGHHFAHHSNHFYRTLFRSGLTPIQVAPKDDRSMLDQCAPFFSLGLTNLAARPTRMAQEVGKEENVVGAQILTTLIRLHRPCLGIFIGIGVARAFEQSVNRATVHIKGQVKKEEQQQQIEHVQLDMDATGQETSICVPSDVPLVGEPDLGVGVGLMPIAIRHQEGVKWEEDEEGGTCMPRLPFTLLFSSPSTSGRVTSHQLPEKTECMRRARILMEYLAGQRRDETATKQVTLRLI